MYLTAHDDKDTVRRAKRTEPMAFLIKPFKPSELTNTVEIALHRSRAEKKVRERERSFLSAMDSVGDAVLTTDFEGHIRFMNRAAEELTGWTQPEALGQAITDVVLVVDEQESSAEQFRLLLSSGAVPEPGGGHECRVHARSSGDHWVTVKVTSIAAAPDNRVRVVVMQDVTRRKATELEIQRLNQELQARISDLTAVNQELESFNYSIAHDLRAPIRHIDAYSKALLERPGMGLPEDARIFLERVRRGASRMGRMVDELLELSRTSRKEPVRQLTKLSSVVEELMAELKAETQGREIEWLLQELPAIHCDPTLIRQVFANLLANAVKFTRPRKHAVIEIGQVRISGQPVLFVRDNGVGFSLKHADKLFGVFQRLHRREDFEGSGIGLATVQRIVHKHGGRVWAEAELEKGATFYFTLEPSRQTSNLESAPLHLENGNAQRSS
ncbi:MAG TPA: ATP-binding protein [Bryobacteraceae bacterium]|nr:ATP-binding protein [Bryobacteraceae bacterium]